MNLRYDGGNLGKEILDHLWLHFMANQERRR
jgi:hypothetical protein